MEAQRLRNSKSKQKTVDDFLTTAPIKRLTPRSPARDANVKFFDDEREEDETDKDEDEDKSENDKKNQLKSQKQKVPVIHSSAFIGDTLSLPEKKAEIRMDKSLETQRCLQTKQDDKKQRLSPRSPRDNNVKFFDDEDEEEEEEEDDDDDDDDDVSPLQRIQSPMSKHSILRQLQHELSTYDKNISADDDSTGLNLDEKTEEEKKEEKEADQQGEIDIEEDAYLKVPGQASSFRELKKLTVNVNAPSSFGDINTLIDDEESTDVLGKSWNGPGPDPRSPR